VPQYRRGEKRCLESIGNGGSIPRVLEPLQANADLPNATKRGTVLDPTTLSLERINEFPIWDLDPDLLNIGPLTVRFYGLLFAVGILLGYYLWRWQMDRGGHHRATTEKFMVWGVIAVLVGSRLGHCLFYEPEVYLRDPIRILFIWQGGLASHGATIGLIVTLWLYSKRYGFHVLEVMDRFAMSATMGATFVRLGNFMNSEIVGRVWDGPWAVRFPSYEHSLARELAVRSGARIPFDPIALPRHPSQLYEALGGLAVFAMLLIVDKIYGEKRPRGLLAALFMLGYFSFRFMVEFVKEYQVFLNITRVDELKMVFIAPTNQFDMGQYLSIPMLAIGLGFLIYAIKVRGPAATLSPIVDVAEPQPAPKASKKK